MNESTAGVALQSGFLSDLLSSYDMRRETSSAPLFEMTTDLDPDQLQSDPSMNSIQS